jgi:uncharacterized protein (DUF305 family)
MPTHAGMMTDAQMSELEQAGGVEGERLFLQLMIDHHQGAIDAAETELDKGVHPPARELAASIAASQSAEIAEMRHLLSQL